MSRKINNKFFDKTDLILRKNKNIDWNESCKQHKLVKIIYEDVEYVFKLISYDKNGRIKFMYNNKIYDMNRQSLTECKINKIIYPESYDYKYSVGNIVILKKCNFKVIKQIRLFDNGKNVRGYTLQCMRCSEVFDISEKKLKETLDCPLCGDSIKRVVPGINTLWDTHPEIAEMLINKSEGYLYSYGSTYCTDWKCPRCGNIIKNKQIQNVVKHGLACRMCGDGISRPNKIMFNILKQSNIKFYPEKQFKWCKFKKYNNDSKMTFGIYDFYLPDYNIIIEMDGDLGHGKVVYDRKKKSPEETLYIDEMKIKLAKEHNINIIHIHMSHKESLNINDCKNIFEKSYINSIIDIKNINWEDVMLYAEKSLMLDVCEMWNNGLSTQDIFDETNLSKSTIRNYLQRGKKYKLCDYSSEVALSRSCKSDSEVLKTYNYSDRIKVVCQYYNENPSLNNVQIGKYFNINSKTIGQYLRDGADAGICSYAKRRIKSEEEKYSELTNVKRRLAIKVEYKNDTTYFKSRKVVKQYILKKYNIILTRETIKQLVLGELEEYQGFKILYISKEEFNKQCDINKENTFGEKYSPRHMDTHN